MATNIFEVAEISSIFRPISTCKCFLETSWHLIALTIIKALIFQNGENFQNGDQYILSSWNFVNFDRFWLVAFWKRLGIIFHSKLWKSWFLIFQIGGNFQNGDQFFSSSWNFAGFRQILFGNFLASSFVQNHQNLDFQNGGNFQNGD
jgi:hypothetical protein